MSDLFPLYMSFQPKTMTSQYMYPSLGSRFLKPALSYPHFGNNNYIIQFIHKTFVMKYRSKAYACTTTTYFESNIDNYKYIERKKNEKYIDNHNNAK